MSLWRFTVLNMRDTHYLPTVRECERCEFKNACGGGQKCFIKRSKKNEHNKKRPLDEYNCGEKS